MTFASLTESILDYPWPLKHYERWLAQRSTTESDDYLYSQPRVRLVVHDDDRLAIANSVSVEKAGQGTVVRIAGQPSCLALSGINREQAHAVINALNSRPTAIELPFASGVPVDACDRLLSVGFGNFVFAPESLQQLESRARAAEIVRFPGSPYELVRNYWRNVGSLNEELDRSLDDSRSSSRFLDWLRALHMRLLLGADLLTYYCPSSPLAQRRAEPGALYHNQSRTLKTSSGVFLLDGPRVNASAIGGPQYHAELDRSLGLQRSMTDSKEYFASGAAWGQLVVARSRADARTQEWFLPTRPMLDSHWDTLFRAWTSTLDAIERRDTAAGAEHLGRFHWCFVHLHPFTCANQSLAFAMVNWALNHLIQSGIPHLILDQLALRHDCADYVRLFARALANWGTNEAEPAVRHMSRVRKKQALEEFIEQLTQATDNAIVQDILERSVKSARLALLLD